MVLDLSTVTTIPLLNVPHVIQIGYHLTDHIALDLTRNINNVSNYVIITDTQLAPLYLDTLYQSIQSHLKSSQRLLTRILPCGEQSKSRAVKASIEDFLLNEKCTRDTCLIALGGGVIGDLVGFVASTFMRGVPFVQIPTTLLAMVDSSIGGKTAIDTVHGKNLIGTFWQPKRIYMNLSVLGTLPKREIANGMAEVIKTFAISNQAEFAKLESGKSQIESAILGFSDENDNAAHLGADKAFLLSVISACAAFKANVVTQDEKEGGLRGLLNFGHTLGHAYEAHLSPAWLHGECVSLGLIHEAELSSYLGYCPSSAVDRLKRCLQSYDLPIQFDEYSKKKLELAQVMDTMKVDKKNKGAQKRVVLIKDIGSTLESKPTDVDDAAIEQVLAKYIFSSASDGNTSSMPNQERYFMNTFPLEISIDSVNLSPHLHTLSMALKKMGVDITIQDDQHVKLSGNDSRKEIRIYLTQKAGSTKPSSNGDAWYEYVVLPLQKADSQFVFYVLHFINITMLSQSRHISPAQNKQTTFVTPTISSYATVLPNFMKQWLEGTDAIEFRVDHLVVQDTTEDWVANVGLQLAHLRQLTRLPIIYTVRTQPQAGKFDPTHVDLYETLLQWGHRWGCDYIDMESSTLSEERQKAMMEMNQDYENTKMISSFHDPNHTFSWSDAAMKKVYQQAKSLFDAYDHQGVIKLVGFADTFYDNIELEQFRHQVDADKNKEIILINMGVHGRFSRVSNQFLSPATHPTMSSAAAPGQLSVNELSNLRKELHFN
ncbi:3-dehydroquinate dehydratase (3-dehydroquinase) [Mucor circinelloides]